MNDEEFSFQDIAGVIDGYDPDMMGVFEQRINTAGSADVPPMHPGKHAVLSDEEVAAAVENKFGNNYMKFNKKFRCHYKRYDLGNEEHVESLENMVTNCLQKGWILAKEEWHHTKDGQSFVIVKCLEPVAKGKRRGQQ